MPMDSRDKKKKLARLEDLDMPAPRSPEEDDLDIDALAAEDAEMEEGSEEDQMSPLADYSDEELLAEVEARGLSAELAESDELEEDDLEAEEDEDYEEDDLELS